MLVSLKKFGVDHAVNPKYVTSIEPGFRKNYKPELPPRTPMVQVWVVGHSGYGTYSIDLLDVTVEEVRHHLNRAENKRTKVLAGDGA